MFSDQKYSITNYHIEYILQKIKFILLSKSVVKT